MGTSTINYVIPHISQNLIDSSPFQGFTPGILKSSNFIRKILTLPPDYSEFLTSRDRSIALRADTGSYSIIPVETPSLSRLPISPNSPLWCLFSDEETIGDIETLIKKFRQPILHVSTVNGRSAIHIDRLDIHVVESFGITALKYCLDHADKPIAGAIKNLLGLSRSIWDSGPKLKSKSHNCATPNELSLLSLRYSMDLTYSPPKQERAAYTEAVTSTADTVTAVRRRALGNLEENIIRVRPSTSLLLAAPSIYRMHFHARDFFQAVRREEGNLVAKGLRRMIVSQTEFNVQVEPSSLEAIMKSQMGSYLLHSRQLELESFTLAVAIKAASHVAPALRLPPGVNSVMPLLLQLGNCSRSNGRNRIWKLNRLVEKLISQWAPYITKEYIDRIRAADSHVKIVSDVPLEWLQLDGLPLMLAKSTSRIPTTPGNVCLAECIEVSNIYIKPDSLLDVLIVRSFSNDDPLKELLTTALNSFDPIKETGIRTTIVDVDSEKDLITALNNFRGAILIYDGHGATQGYDDIAGLKIGNNVIDMWRLKGVARVPPIVILSACDTHPIDGSHASTALGFITSGAITVVATLMPVGGMSAAVFIARLLYRIGAYIPAATEYVSIRWSDVVVGMQRMTYASEMIFNMLGEIEVEDEQAFYEEAQLQANHWINGNDSKWHEKLINLLATMTNQSVESVRNILSKYGRLTQSLTYIQVGNPERIVIVGEKIEAVVDNQARIYGTYRSGIEVPSPAND